MSSLETVRYLDETFPAAMLFKRKGKLPIHEAVYNSSVDATIIEYLIERDPTCVKTRVEVDFGDGLHGSLPLSIHVLRPRLDIVECLLRHYPGAVNEQDGLRDYPLHQICASSIATRELIECLAAADPRALERKDKDGRNSLGKALAFLFRTTRSLP